ncbi:hypothetical protein [Lentzea aerocolonigenes]|uniref:response regulator transcription factor n=1 Tax=Lentzea aerocolonigenes TaxID=68170 RepID=UPI002ED049C8
MIRVLLADDEELIRDALAALLDLEPDLEVVARAGDGRAAVEAALSRPHGRTARTSPWWTCRCRSWTAWRSPRSSPACSRRARW